MWTPHHRELHEQFWKGPFNRTAGSGPFAHIHLKTVTKYSVDSPEQHYLRWG